MASAADMEAGELPVPPAPGATTQEKITNSKEKPEKGGAGKDHLAELKAVVLSAMATKDADNAIILQRIQQRFERYHYLMLRFALTEVHPVPEHDDRGAHDPLGHRYLQRNLLDVIRHTCTHH